MKSLSTLAVQSYRVDGSASLAELVSREPDGLYKLLVEGETLQCVRDNGTVRPYQLAFEPSLHHFRYGKKSRSKRVATSALLEVRVGPLTQTLLTHCETEQEARSFALVYRAAESGNIAVPHTVSLLCCTAARRDQWAHALNVLMLCMQNADAEAYSLVHPFQDHLKKDTDTLDAKLLKKLLISLGVADADVKRTLKTLESDGVNSLAFSDFVKVIRKLRSHLGLTYVFSKYAKDEKLGAQELVQLLRVEQKQEVTETEAMSIIRVFGGGQNWLDDVTFQMFMSSSWNSAWDPRRQALHHDMSRPLNEYFINSSHNTYLSGGQLNGLSSIEMYIFALALGCRCLEIDIWDGPNEEPIVYHGYTLTSKIFFRDVLRVIRSHGFQGNPYPIILSFENHASRPVQEKMSAYIREILGDMVYVHKSKTDPLPSPTALQKRILIKGSKHTSFVSESFQDLADDMALKVEADDVSKALSKEEQAIYAERVRLMQEKAEAALRASALSKQQNDDGKGHDHQRGDDLGKTSGTVVLAEAAVDVATAGIPTLPPHRQGSTVPAFVFDGESAAKSLNELIGLQAIKIHDFLNLGSAAYASWEPSSMSSFGEARMLKILGIGENGYQAMRKFCSKHIARVYPKGSRFDSSNYNPILFWYAGVQMLALNFQTLNTYPMLINYAKFHENGNCGYNLRPQYLNKIVPASGRAEFGRLVAVVERFTRPKPICSRLRVQVFGARHLQSPVTALEVSLHDGSARENKRVLTCDNPSGFCPDFEFDETFPVLDSANCYLTMIVFTKSESVAFFSIPLECLREGYRTCKLIDAYYRPIAKGICHLLCRFEKIQEK